MSALDGFKATEQPPSGKLYRSKYAQIIEEFMASGNYIMVKDLKDATAARKLAGGITQYHYGKSSRNFTAEGHERTSPWPGFRCVKRGTCVYLINDNLGGEEQ